MVVKKLICGTVFSYRGNIVSFEQGGGIMNQRNFSYTIRHVRMQAVAGCSSAALSCHLWPKTFIFCFTILSIQPIALWSQKECCISRYHIHAHPHLIILPKKKKKKRHPLIPYPQPSPPDDFPPFGNRTVSQAHVKLQERFSTLWWKVTRDKLSANSLNHLVNILYWLCFRVRMFRLSEYSKCAALFSLFVIMGEWNKNDFLSSQSLILKLSRSIEVIFNCYWFRSGFDEPSRLWWKNQTTAEFEKKRKGDFSEGN